MTGRRNEEVPPNVGDTVRLRAEFKDFDEELFDPSDIKLKIYDRNQEDIDGPFTYNTEDPVNSEIQKESTGVYTYEYTLPIKEAIYPLYFEYSGKIRNKPILRRGKIEATFAEE